ELLQDLKDRGDLVRDAEGRCTQARQLDWTALPARVEGIIGERVNRLADHFREELGVASVVGVDFSAQVISRVQDAPEREVIRDLSRELDRRYRLVEEQAESRVGDQFISAYRFRHALIQQYLYDELGPGQRRLTHADVAHALEGLYGGHLDGI